MCVKGLDSGVQTGEGQASCLRFLNWPGCGFTSGHPGH